MILTHFKATQIYGFIDCDICFNESVCLLKGENGSGKTTALRLIYAFLSHDLKLLESVEFESCLLEGKLDSGKTFSLSMNKISNNEFEFTFLHQNYPDIKLKFIKSGVDFLSNSQEINNNDILKAFKLLSAPHFLDINRKLFSGVFSPINKNQFILSRLYRDYPFEHPMLGAIKNAQDTLYVLIQNIDKKLLQLESKKPLMNQSFKNNLILNSFEFFDDQEVELIDNHKTLTEMRENAIEAFENMNLNGFVENVNLFFNQLEEIQTNVLENDNKTRGIQTKNAQNLVHYQQWLLNQPQLKRFNQIIQFNKAYKKDREKLYAPIERIKNVVNLFLIKLDKTLIISKNGEIQVEMKNGKKSKFYELSNAEIHIISMVIHLVYFIEINKLNRNIIIIDEVDISIHPSWQLILADVLIDFSNEIQLIFSCNSNVIIESFSNNQVISI
jgi:predicted ATP-binding protein involved in virulence